MNGLMSKRYSRVCNGSIAQRVNGWMIITIADFKVQGLLDNLGSLHSVALRLVLLSPPNRGPQHTSK